MSSQGPGSKSLVIRCVVLCFLYGGAVGILDAVHADPLVTSPSWIAEGDQTDALLGYSVADAGDVNNDGYDDVIVGESNYTNGQQTEGRAMVFHGTASGLSAVPAWIAEGDTASSLFGRSVAGAGDVNNDGYDDVIVGAPGRGFVRLYCGGPAGLSSTPAWAAAKPSSSGEFGCSVACAGDVNNDGYDDVIVGERHYSGGQSMEGRAHVYHGSALGLSLTAEWIAESDVAFAAFGSAVGSAGDVNNDGYSDVIIGAPDYNNGHSGEGKAYVYRGASKKLASIPSWEVESDLFDTRFGCSVGCAGDVNGDGYDDVIVGAYSLSHFYTDEGGAYVYEGGLHGVGASPSWTAMGEQNDAFFGASVGSAGDVNGDGYSDVIVGAYGYSDVESYEGAAFVYLGSASGVLALVGWSVESDHAGAAFGLSASCAGDVNDDGLDDVIVGASQYDTAVQDEGRAYVYHGGSDSVPAPLSIHTVIALVIGLVVLGGWILWSAEFLA